MGQVPEIFEKGLHCVIRRAVIIGNGQAGAEHQSLGLVRALGLGDACILQRVTRPRDGLNRYLRFLPLKTHARLDSFLKRYTPSLLSPTQWLPGRARTLLGWQQGEVDLESEMSVPEVDPERIAELARQGVYREGPILVVACGRDTWPAAALIRHLAPEATFVVQIQHPRTDVSQFDLVITPAHDYYNTTPEGHQEQVSALPILGRHPSLLPRLPERLQGLLVPKVDPPARNVVLTLGALHHVDPPALRSAAARWHDVLAPLPKPLLAVNIGGPTVHCRYGQDLAEELCQALGVLSRFGGSVRISLSRRTPPAFADYLRQQLEGQPRVYIWDGRGPDSHLGHLAWADVFVVTADSVSMLSEACSTAKPVYVIGSGRCTGKLAAFHRSLRKRGATRAFTGAENLRESWSYPPLNDNAEAAQRVRAALAEKGWSIG